MMAGMAAAKIRLVLQEPVAAAVQMATTCHVHL
jgi:hypothetical protein